jgi:hypothetical protein
MRKLSPINYWKKSMNDNIDPWAHCFQLRAFLRNKTRPEEPLCRFLVNEHSNTFLLPSCKKGFYINNFVQCPNLKRNQFLYIPEYLSSAKFQIKTWLILCSNYLEFWEIDQMFSKQAIMSKLLVCQKELSSA